MDFSLLLCFVFIINSVFCEEFKCPERGKVGELKVPNVLELIDKQTGYHATVEVINPTRNNLVHDFYDIENKIGFIDLEAIIQDKMNRRYYYHSTEEKIAVRENTCTRLDLTQNEKIESIKDWFEPAGIVADSEMFKDFIHFGPTGLMVYAHSISDKASFIGSELIDGRSVNHWFYCTNPNGPYIDFYFDVKTSLPYRFSLYYPEWIDAEEFLQVGNKSTAVKKQVDSESKYVYNFFTFKPLVISPADPIPYPLGYGCARKNTSPTHPLPDFSQIKAFTMDMEAIITYPDGSMVKSTARVMKQGDVISYEITEGTEFVRSIELPPPLGLFEVDEHSGQCRYRTSVYNKDVTLITKWPLKPSFNLLYYLVMKPSRDHPTTFIGDIPLGPFRVEEYRATNFLPNSIDAIIDYYYSSDKVKVPYKVVFTKDRSQFSLTSPDKIEVTIIDYRDDYFDFEDRFDVSGCYEKPGAFNWFQLVFSNPWMNDVTLELVRQEVQESLLKFIPITRIGQIHAVNIDTNVYVTVKLHDRIHLIDTYQVKRGYTISSPTDIVQKLTPEDCEQLCSSTTACYDFSYCSNFDCFILAFPSSSIIDTQYNEDCNLYRRVWFGHKLSEYVKGNHLSSMLHVLQQIRNKVSEGQFVLHSAALTAEDLFIVSGPDEIGDISQEYKQGTFRPVKGEDFPLIKTGRHFNEAQFKIEKGSLTECFMACLNDEDCNTLSYCINKNKECILSGETSTTLDNKLEDKTSHADGCNIYEKSFINLFSEFPGKNLVLDAVSTVSNVIITDCAKACAQAKDFNCESFDYCSDNNNRNGSICYLHVNHIETDTAHEINRTNWKFAEDGCTHFSKKSDRDYEHKVGYSLKDDVKESVVGTFSHLSLDHCASKCNSNPDCFTLEFCETIGYDSTFDSSFSSSSCRLTNLKSTSVVNQTQFFEQSKDPKKICSIFINHMKIIAKDKSKESSPSTMKSNHFNLAIGTGAAIFILSLAGGFVGFTFASRKGLI